MRSALHRKNHILAVSYTHLDVYKRQLSKHFGIAPDKIENCRTYGGHGEQMAVYAATAKVDGKPLLDIIGTPDAGTLHGTCF